MSTVRRPWLFFGILLICGIIAFSVKADWSVQSWLDLADFDVSVIGTVGVLIYAVGRSTSGGAFWGAFRRVFVSIASAQVLVHSIEAANRHQYSVAGTVVFVVVVAVLVGWIFALQWIAMTRLAQER